LLDASRRGELCLDQNDVEDFSNRLEDAWQYLQLNAGDPYLPDVISLADVRNEWPAFKKSLVRKVEGGEYSPTVIDVIDFPKDALNVRPLSRFSLEDRLVYEACLFTVAPIIDAAIPRRVFSYRWSRWKRRLYSPKTRWIHMQRRARQIHRRNLGHLLLRTDISAFYEYIDLGILHGELRRLELPSWALSTLEDFLRDFNSFSKAWGLPQGPDTSGVLANLYLLPLDNMISRLGLQHVRYSDDLMVFAPTWKELKSVLMQLNGICRSRHLTLSSAKTKIIPAAEVPAEFEDTSKDAIRYGIDIAAEDSAENLRLYFDTAAEAINVRDIRFSLNQLLRIEDDWAVGWLLGHLQELPHMADDAVRYLTKFRAKRGDIDEAIAAMLANGDFSLYPPVERRVIQYLVLSNTFKPKALDKCWEIVSDSNRSSIVREFAARYVGRFCRTGDGAQLRELYERESIERVRRAILIACYEAGDYPQQFVKDISRTNTTFGRTARYLLTEPEIIPCPPLDVVW
jgi:hypothetical protein